ncbi:MAG: YARHG domain-containing protein, partial [bacterium]
YSTDCPGYASAYLNQQCSINALYSTTCSGYAQAYFNQQSWYNPQYSPQEFPVDLLSKIEVENAEFINQYQDQNNLRYFR